MDDARARWRRVAASQAGLITRRQLVAAGISRWTVADRVAAERWQNLAPTVVGTFTGELTEKQRRWLALLHAGDDALLSGLTAAEEAGLRNWKRAEVHVLVPYSSGKVSSLEGVTYSRTRRSLIDMRRPGARPPRCKLEPAILMFAASDRSTRTAQGVLAASVQQGLTTPTQLMDWIDRLAPLKRATTLRRALKDIEGGVQSVGEQDVRRMCRRFGLPTPLRQARRRDSSGRSRFTDCEWRLASGHAIVLEVDGAFHMAVEHWEDDIARQRALSALDRTIVRCTARELRDTPERVARDLKLLGIREL